MSEKALYEVVSAQVLLAKRQEFQRLHKDILLPLCNQNGIEVILCLMSDVGSVGKFIDVFRYKSYNEYDLKSTSLEESLYACNYYEHIQNCIQGSITVELMSSFNIEMEL